MQQKYFYYAWAVAGDTTPIPLPTQGDGSVSYQAGYGADYQLNLATDPSAIAIERAKMNSFFNDVTLNLQNYQQYGSPEWIDSSDNQGAPFPYDIGANVRYRSGSSGPFTNYVSLVSGNTTVPGTAGYWAVSLAAYASGRLTPSGNAEWTAPGSYTYTVPAGCYTVRYRGAGAGGGSGGTAPVASGMAAVTAGGNAGATMEGTVSVTPGQVLAVVIGAAGAAGDATGSNGAQGGSSTLTVAGTVYTAPGGHGSSGNSGFAPPFIIAPHNISAVAAGASILNGTEIRGTSGFAMADAQGEGGAGGTCQLGAGLSGNGGDGVYAGASSAGQAGNPGNPGCLIIEAYT